MLPTVIGLSQLGHFVHNVGVREYINGVDRMKTVDYDKLVLWSSCMGLLSCKCAICGGSMSGELRQSSGVGRPLTTDQITFKESVQPDWLLTAQDTIMKKQNL